MNLPKWCQTHSFKEFLELLEEKKGNEMNEMDIKNTDPRNLPEANGVKPDFGKSLPTEEVDEDEEVDGEDTEEDEGCKLPSDEALKRLSSR